MPTFPHSKTLSVTIDCSPQDVYDYVSNPENLPKWAFCKSVSQQNDVWVMETEQGPVPVRFVEKNDLGVLDHFVKPTPDVEIYVPMRVIPNGSGSEVLFTVFQLSEMSDEMFNADAATVEKDLRTLKSLLEW